jgi:hypothetical protein
VNVDTSSQATPVRLLLAFGLRAYVAHAVGFRDQRCGGDGGRRGGWSVPGCTGYRTMMLMPSSTARACSMNPRGVILALRDFPRVWGNWRRRGWDPRRTNANTMMTSWLSSSRAGSLIRGGVLLRLGGPLGRWGNMRMQGWDPRCADANVTTESSSSSRAVSVARGGGLLALVVLLGRRGANRRQGGGLIITCPRYPLSPLLFLLLHPLFQPPITIPFSS